MTSPPRPIVLGPATPSELLTYIIENHRYPTTILVGWPKQQFIQALVEDVARQVDEQEQNQEQGHEGGDMSSHPLVRSSLLQTAVSRHIRMLFIPTVTHLRAYLGTFSASDSKIPAPPVLPNRNNNKSSIAVVGNTNSPPLLLVYGFLEIHRDGTEWSAQGLNTSAAGLIESAMRNSFRAAIVEPRGAVGFERLDEFLNQIVPVLNLASVKNGAAWSGRTVSIGRVLGRWFEFDNEPTPSSLEREDETIESTV